MCPLPKTKSIQNIHKDYLSQALVGQNIRTVPPVNHMRDTCNNVDPS